MESRTLISPCNAGAPLYARAAVVHEVLDCTKGSSRTRHVSRAPSCGSGCQGEPLRGGGRRPEKGCHKVCILLAPPTGPRTVSPVTRRDFGLFMKKFDHRKAGDELYAAV